jgi:Ca-activated chloride channel homolog
MINGVIFSQFVPALSQKAKGFDQLFDLLRQLLTMTSGDVAEAMNYLTQLDRKYQLTDDQYGIGQFYEDLKERGYIVEEQPEGGNRFKITPKTEQAIRKGALEEIFGKLKKTPRGDHQMNRTGQGEELSADRRDYRFGDTLDHIDMTESLKNAQINHGLMDFSLAEGDLEIIEKETKSQTSTVLMIDISHSMILYGEDRITPAKKVAMALAELITTKYPKDTLDIIVFGNDAWQIKIKDLPYLEVGPYHTNTISGLELAQDLLRRKKTPNKQIFMITDGKPTCMKVGLRYYKNSFGLDRKIINKTLNLGAHLKKMNIPVTTFMIATDPYLQQFVRDFTEANSGQAYYSSLQGLGKLVFEDYKKNRKKNL